MMKVITLATASALVLAAAVSSEPAYARHRNNGGAVAAGVIGGLALGAIIGSQTNYGPGYYGPQEYQPVYRDCRMEREQYVGQDGRYHSRRIRVCD